MGKYKRISNRKRYRMRNHLVKVDKAQRRCLGECGQLFASKHSANRICPLCQEINSFISDESEVKLAIAV